jgi:hypothetical protein
MVQFYLGEVAVELDGKYTREVAVRPDYFGRNGYLPVCLEDADYSPKQISTPCNYHVEKPITC